MTTELNHSDAVTATTAAACRPIPGVSPQAVHATRHALDNPTAAIFSVPDGIRHRLASAYLDGGAGALLREIRAVGLQVDSFTAADVGLDTLEEARSLNTGDMMVASITGLADLGGYDILVGLPDDGRFKLADLHRATGMLLVRDVVIRDRELFQIDSFDGDAITMGAVFYPDVTTFAFVGGAPHAAVILQ